MEMDTHFWDGKSDKYSTEGHDDERGKTWQRKRVCSEEGYIEEEV